MASSAQTETPMATLRLFADSLEPDDIERITAVKAEYSARKGGSLLRKDCGYVAAKTGTWFVTTEHKGIGKKPEDHLKWVINLVGRHRTQLRDAIPDLQVDLSLLVHDSSFKIKNLPASLLREAVGFGDLEIEVPPQDLDVVITPDNVAQFVAN